MSSPEDGNAACEASRCDDLDRGPRAAGAARFSDRPILADRVLSGSAVQQPSGSRRRGCAGDRGRAGGDRTAWPLGLLEVLRPSARSGYAWKHKRVYRVYCALGLNQARRMKKRLPKRDSVPLNARPQLNTTSATDLMGDSLYRGRSYRRLNVVDEGNREALAIKVDSSLPSTRVVAVLDHLIAQHGAPRQRRCNNVLHPLSSGQWARTMTEACVEPASRWSRGATPTPPAVLHTTRVPC